MKQTLQVIKILETFLVLYLALCKQFKLFELVTTLV